MEVEIALLGEVPAKVIELAKDVIEGYLNLKTSIYGFLTYKPDKERLLAYEILKNARKRNPNDYLLVITSKDIYHPGYNFLFGLAIPLERKAVVSFHRLLCGIEQIELERIAKEIIHELGHLLGLEHCSNPRCVMRFSNTVFEVDEKSWKFCPSCKKSLMSKEIIIRDDYFLNIGKYIQK